jgi:hypothetical protein
MLPAILSSYRPRADGSWSITLSTNILRADEKVVIDGMHQQLCCVLLKDSEVLNDELEAFDSVEMDLIDAKITPSQRFRNILYRLWEQTEKLKGEEESKSEFKEFYKVKMEQLCEHFKGKLI